MLDDLLDDLKKSPFICTLNNDILDPWKLTSLFFKSDLKDGRLPIASRPKDYNVSTPDIIESYRLECVERLHYNHYNSLRSDLFNGLILEGEYLDKLAMLTSFKNTYNLALVDEDYSTRVSDFIKSRYSMDYVEDSGDRVILICKDYDELLEHTSPLIRFRGSPLKKIRSAFSNISSVNMDSIGIEFKELVIDGIKRSFIAVSVDPRISDMFIQEFLNSNILFEYTFKCREVVYTNNYSSLYSEDFLDEQSNIYSRHELLNYSNLKVNKFGGFTAPKKSLGRISYMIDGGEISDKED